MKKAVTGRSKRRRLARFKIAKQKSQEEQKKRRNIRIKQHPAARLCRFPAPRRNSMIVTRSLRTASSKPSSHTHTTNKLLTTHHFAASTIWPSPLSVLLTGLLSRSVLELLLVDMVSERLGLLLLDLVELVGLCRPAFVYSISLRTGKFEGVVERVLDS